MQINEATHILVIFYAIFELIKQGKHQSVKNILDFIGDPKLSTTTVKKHLETLIKWQALTPKYQSQGIAEKYTNLQPTNIPEFVYKNRVSPSNKTRWKKLYVEQTNIAKWVNNQAIFDPEGFVDSVSEEMIVNMVNGYKKIAQPDLPKFTPDEALEFFKDVIRGQKVDFGEVFLEDLHYWLCSEVVKFYADT